MHFDPYRNSMVAHHGWVTAVTSYYGISTRPHVEIGWNALGRDEGEVAVANLWKWLEDFYLNDQVAVFAQDNFCDDAIRSHHIELRTIPEYRLRYRKME
jgi:hypothetical protein